MEEKIEYPQFAKEIFKKAKVAVLCPVFGRLDYRFMLSLANLIGHSCQHGVTYVGMTVAHRFKTVAARNRLLDSVKDVDGVTHLLWIDEDHTFKPNLLCNLLSRDRNYITPLMFQKIPPHYTTIYQKDKEVEFGYHSFIRWPKAIFEVDGTGFGCVLMRKEVPFKLEPPYFEEKTGAFGHDLHFCSKLKEKGINLFCDGTQDIKHIAYVAPEYGLDDYMKFQPGEIAKVKTSNISKKLAKADGGEGVIENAIL